MESAWSVSKLSTESVGSCRELVANCVHTTYADATKQFRRVGGVYWALASPQREITLWIWGSRPLFCIIRSTTGVSVKYCELFISYR